MFFCKTMINVKWTQKTFSQSYWFFFWNHFIYFLILMPKKLLFFYFLFRVKKNINQRSLIIKRKKNTVSRYTKPQTRELINRESNDKRLWNFLWGESEKKKQQIRSKMGHIWTESIKMENWLYSLLQEETRAYLLRLEAFSPALLPPICCYLDKSETPSVLFFYWLTFVFLFSKFKQIFCVDSADKTTFQEKQTFKQHFLEA